MLDSYNVLETFRSIIWKSWNQLLLKTFFSWVWEELENFHTHVKLLDFLKLCTHHVGVQGHPCFISDPQKQQPSFNTVHLASLLEERAALYFSGSNLLVYEPFNFDLKVSWLKKKENLSNSSQSRWVHSPWFGESVRRSIGRITPFSPFCFSTIVVVTTRTFDQVNYFQ